MNKFYLIRHGNIPHIAGNPGLSDIGIQQAKLTALHFRDKGITEIYCSPFKRTQETARIITKELNIEDIKTDDRLKERLNWGDDPSQSFDDFIKEWRKTTIDRSYSPPKGNSSKNAGKRLKEFVDELATHIDNQNIIVVAHGGVITDLLRNMFNDEYLKTFSPGFLNMGIGECSITQLEYLNGTYLLKEFDSVDHLPKLLRLWGSGW
ncbi:MAG: histidine phosphatase family protein [bacterium]|nr:histidine phosphatase family protein [bacterium]